MTSEVETRVNIFGMDICSMSFDEAVCTLLDWLEEKEQSRFVVTPNVNHLVLYQENKAFRQAYGKASLVLPDGRYVILISKVLKQPLLGPINGSDLVPALMTASEKRGGITVFLLGAMPGIADTAAINIEEGWPHVDVVGTYSPPIGFEDDATEVQYIISQINRVEPDVLIVGISPPKQEIWVSEHVAEIQATVIICAGATIDFIANAKPRAPLWMQRSGLEWVFRTLAEPRRLIPRYINDGISVVGLLYTELRKKGS